MRIESLEIENFRAIAKASLLNLTDFVVIAGPNGCGKSCVFHALRLLKSLYGGYQRNEWQQWGQEFQIDLSRPEEAKSLLRDASTALRLSASFALLSVEKEYLKTNARRLIELTAWQDVSSNNDSTFYPSNVSVARESRVSRDLVAEKTKQGLKDLEGLLEEDSLIGELIIAPDGQLTTTDNVALEIIFSNIETAHLGMIDYHGPNRNYSREQVGGIQLQITAEEKRYGNALYNYAQKYNKIKSEMAGAYLRQLLAKERGIEVEQNDLTETLKELFRVFFPGKTFQGVQVNSEGLLDFPVLLEGGASHDIDELSSGEKEVLFGYLRLRSYVPNRSVILIDEPELHLNPRLVRGLPSFYNDHIGQAFENQMWMATHSDALLREAVTVSESSVYHMQSAGDLGSSGDQLTMLTADNEIEKAIIDLVGDLATFLPDGKIVIFEGENSEFDVKVVRTLFSDICEKFNPISGGNKTGVKKLRQLLEKAVEEIGVRKKVYAVTDRDSEDMGSRTAVREFRWDVYHIENYLLESDAILQVLTSLDLTNEELDSSVKVENALKDAANHTIEGLVKHRIQQAIWRGIRSRLQIEPDGESTDLAASFSETLKSSLADVIRLAETELSPDALKEMERTCREEYSQFLSDGEWKHRFRGRDVLKSFLGKHGKGRVNYDAFRRLILDRMRETRVKPAGMLSVLEAIEADS